MYNRTVTTKNGQLRGIAGHNPAITAYLGVPGSTKILRPLVLSLTVIRMPWPEAGSKCADDWTDGKMLWSFALRKEKDHGRKKTYANAAKADYWNFRGLYRSGEGI